MSDLPFLPEVVRAIARGAVDRRCLVGITGPPGSGKSTLADALAKQLVQAAGKQVAVLRMDGYHMTNAKLHENGRFLWKGCHFTFEAKQFVDKVRDLKMTLDDIRCPTYDRDRSHDPIIDDYLIGGGQKVVIVEGNYLLSTIEPWQELITLLDYVVFLDVDPDLQLQRLLERHQKAGRTAEAALAKAQSTDLPNSSFVRANKQLADYYFVPDYNIT